MERKAIVIVCPSKGRASNVLTKKLINDLVLVVPEYEVEAYEEHNPECTVIAEPEHVRGITASRQFIIETFENVFMIDDDIVSIRKNWIESGEEYLIQDPDYAQDIIQRAGDIATDINAKMFGFANLRDPLHYVSHKPIGFTGYLNASYTGYLAGHDLAYDVSYPEGEDHYMSCLNVYKNRYMFIDHRYSFVTQGNFVAEGGCNLDRTKEDMLLTTLKLRKTFGEVIKIKKPTAGKSKLREGERTVSFPF
tara:strand:+ start:1965 stop:2714 length:750 start_codon:yes stop_codon:yes gene_type:complete